MSKDSKENTYLFVDGAYLEARVLKYSEGLYKEPLEISYEKLGRSARKCFYYDAYPSKKSNQDDSDFQKELSEADARFAHISQNRGWHVNFGLTRGQGKRLRQKGVDVKLALDALTHRLAGNCEKIILLTGDLDFLPLARSLVQAGAWVELLCDQLDTPEDLINACDSRAFIGGRSMLDFLSLKPSIILPDWEEVDYTTTISGDIYSTGSHELWSIHVLECANECVALRKRVDVKKAWKMNHKDIEILNLLAHCDSWFMKWKKS